MNKHKPIHTVKKEIKMTHFLITNECNEETFRIECCFTVYREKFGHHPDFLPQDEEHGKREGFNTKFFYLIEENLTKEQADEKLKQYQNKYDEKLTQIEDDHTIWENFPFKSKELVYCK